MRYGPEILLNLSNEDLSMLVSKHTEERLFALLRSALFDKEINISLFEDITNEDWLEIYNTALDQGVLAFTYDAIKQVPSTMHPDIELKIQWAYNVDHIEKLFNRQLSAAKSLVDILSSDAINTMILKGLSLASLYPTPSHRQSGDIDVYLMGDYKRGNSIISKKGIKVKYDFFVHSEFGINGINVENHLYFVNPNVNKTGMRVQELLSQISSTLPHPIVEGALMPSPEFNALFLTRHSSWHYAREGVHLREVCDWSIFLQKSGESLDKKSIVAMLRECGLERYASIMTTIARKYLDINVSLPFDNTYDQLAERVKEDIFTFENPEKHRRSGVMKVFFCKIRNRISRKWCYDLVVPDSYWGNIWYSIKGYILHPFAIFKAKL
ncbi:MAG: nucleotidyltransferase family protein [Alistipes sp.]|nr:nucleotidyltransferase family protein [Alistipes sp.]